MRDITLFHCMNKHIVKKGIDSHFDGISSGCKYYDPDQLSDMAKNSNNACSYFHLHSGGLSANLVSFWELLCELQRDNFYFDYI